MLRKNSGAWWRNWSGRGFTLVELLVLLAVLAIVAVLATPDLQATIERTRATTSTNDMIAALQFARSEAIRRNDAVSVVPNSDCPEGLSSWQCGWQAVAEGTVLREGPASPGQVRYRSSPNKITFLGSGRLQPATALAFWVVVVDHQDAIRQTARIDLTATGRIRSCRPDSPSENQTCPHS